MVDEIQFQKLNSFRMPPGFRGRSGLYVQIWWCVQATLFRYSPQFLYGWRRWLLRLFGAKVGVGVLVRPTATVTYPWKVAIGDHCWIGDDVVLYSLGQIEVGSHSVISQRSYVCAADHDPLDIAFAIRAKPVTLEPEVWIATDVFVGPGVTVGRGAILGARSSAFSNIAGGGIYHGSPARFVKKRETEIL